MTSLHLIAVANPDPGLLNAVAEALGAEFGLATSILSSRIDPRSAYHVERNQYHSTMLLDRIRRATDDGIVLGITDVDLYIPILTFVFGEAQVQGRVAVVSYHRLHEELYGLEPNRALLEERLIKEAIHETGHVFGLIHCSDYECVMAASHAVEKIDTKSSRFCSDCRSHLH